MKLTRPSEAYSPYCALFASPTSLLQKTSSARATWFTFQCRDQEVSRVRQRQPCRLEAGWCVKGAIDDPQRTGPYRASRATRSRASGTAGAGRCPKMFLVACDATCLDAEIVGKVPPPRVAALFAPVRLSPVCSLSVYTHEPTKIVPVRWL
jgi:hypothetical protein